MVENFVGSEVGDGRCVCSGVDLESVICARTDTNKPGKNEINEAGVEVVWGASETDDGETSVCIVVFLNVKNTTSVLVVVQLGVLFQQVCVIRFADDLGRCGLGIVVKQVGEGGEELGRLIRPRRTVPLAFPLGALISILSHIVLIARLVGTKPMCSSELRRIGQVSPCLGKSLGVIRKVMCPRNITNKLSPSDEIPVLDVRVIDFVPVDEVLEGTVPE
ncbi:uncharacterized protein N7506_003552 [Penicillium brevicompactum]|uniref:uncharacterized protein n=1 Tax=Penicillium brevicompactum TaxID=5074 RepID=UPI0025408CCD|nr:uncharacterized protein N7506_003552 [Penicillium brevicompactum]KAJ5343728.1 hypothetical protein N7506_003552 [Penicillium brevicompactum]